MILETVRVINKIGIVTGENFIRKIKNKIMKLVFNINGPRTNAENIPLTPWTSCFSGGFPTTNEL